MQNILLKSLTVSEDYNVRKTGRENGLDELIASIKAHGLLENLLVIEANDNFEVIAGGRRLTALHSLQKKGELPDDYEVPCELVDTANAEEISLAENMVRTQMHPADQFEAYSKLINDGQSVADIAARFGVADTTVAKMLKLGRVSPELMQAYRNEEFNLEVLMAFTLTDDHEKQMELFNRIKDSWEINQPHSIRSALTEDAERGNSRIAKFVGIEAYEVAGGGVRRDLFGNEDNCYLDDVQLLSKLAEEKLQQKADELQKKWKWVKIMQEVDYNESNKYQRIHSHSIGEVPDELIAKQEELESRIDGDEFEDDCESEEYHAACKELEDTEGQIAEYTGFSDEEYAIAGCIVSIAHNGDYSITEGLVNPEDIKAQKEQGDISNNPIFQTSTVEEVKPRYSQTLTERLKNYRLHSVKKALANDFETAFDTSLYVMCVKAFGEWQYNENCIKVNAEQYNYPYNLTSEDETCIAIEDKEKKLFNKLPLGWLKADSAEDRFECFCNLTEKQKHKLFAACMAKSLQPQLFIEPSASPIFEAISDRMKVDVAKDWRPTADNFLNRVTKADLLVIGEEIFGESWSKEHHKKPKGEVVSLLHEAFSKPKSKQFTEEQQELLMTWLPEGMA